MVLRRPRLHLIPLDDAPEDDPHLTGPSPAVEVERQELRQQVWQALLRLSERQRQVVVLHYFEDWPYARMAEFLEVPENTIRSRLRLAREHLRKEVLKMMEEVVQTEKLGDEFTHRVLEEVRPAPAISPLVSTLQACLQALGRDWSGAYVTGLFGAAFCFAMKERAAEVWQTAHINWWKFFDLLGDLGYTLDVVDEIGNNPSVKPPPTPEQWRARQEEIWEKVQASIDQGRPVIGWQLMTVAQRDAGLEAWEHGLIVGYDTRTKEYVVRHPWAGEYTVPYDGFGRSDPVQWLSVIFFGEPRGYDPRQLEQDSLPQALRYARGEERATDADAYGLAAYDLWGQEVEKGDVDWRGNQSHARFLGEARGHAAAYLRELSGHFAPDVAAALEEAAAAYESEARVLAQFSPLADGWAKPIADFRLPILDCPESGLRQIANRKSQIRYLPRSKPVPWPSCEKPGRRSSKPSQPWSGPWKH